jgi:hypothetical protein
MSVTNDRRRLVSPVNELQKFIIDQMNKLADGSQRKFSDMMGLTDTTLGRALHPTKPSKPSLELLIALARVTKTDIRDIVVMAAPEDVIYGSRRSSAALLARLDKLSDDDRNLIDKFIAGAVARLAQAD